MTRNNVLLIAVLAAFTAILGGIKLTQLKTHASNVEPIVLYSVLPHPYFTGVQNGGNALAKDANTRVRELIGQESSQANVNTNIESMVTLGHKAFSIYPVDPAGSKGLFQRLHDAGCYAVAYGAQPQAGTLCPFAVATDTHAAATMGTEKLVELMGSKGNILNVLESLTDANTPIRKAAIEAVVAKHPGIKIIQTVGDVTTEDKAREKIESALVARGGEIDGVICTGYTTSVAAATLLAQRNGKAENKYIHFVGLDTDDRVLDAIRKGTADATVAQNPFGHGYISCALLNLLLQGWKPKADYQFIDSGCLVVTKANADHFQPQIEDVTRKIVGDLKTKYLTPPAP